MSSFAPFRNLFGNTPKARIIEEMMADPSCRTEKDLRYFGKCSTSTLKVILNDLRSSNLILWCKDCSSWYPNPESRVWVALTLLAFAGNSDEEPANDFILGMEEYLEERTSIFMPFKRQDESKLINELNEYRKVQKFVPSGVT